MDLALPPRPWAAGAAAFADAHALTTAARAELSTLLVAAWEDGGGRASASIAAPAAVPAAAPAVLPLASAVIPNVKALVPSTKCTLHVHADGSGLTMTKDGTAAGFIATIPRDAVAGVFRLVVPASRNSAYAASSTSSAGAGAGAGAGASASPNDTLALIVTLHPGKGVLVGKTIHGTLGWADTFANLRKGGACEVVVHAGAASAPATVWRGEHVLGVVEAALSSLWGTIGGVDPTLFQSRHGGGVSCYLKVNDGMLFPLRRALLFLMKPLLCIPHTAIETMQVGRSGARACARRHCEALRVPAAAVSIPAVSRPQAGLRLAPSTSMCARPMARPPPSP